MNPTAEQLNVWVREAGIGPLMGVFGVGIERFVILAMAGQEEATLTDISEALRRAGATLPAPEVTGTVEGAVISGLCIALAYVEAKLDAIRKPTEAA